MLTGSKRTSQKRTEFNRCGLLCITQTWLGKGLRQPRGYVF